jgi:hypothetical protein
MLQESTPEVPLFTMEFRLFKKNSPDIHYTYEGDVPQEVMDQFQRLVGNGLAKIGFSVPMDMKDFGNGTGAHVFINLTCNQDAATIHQAYLLAMQTAMYYVKQGLSQAMAEFDPILAERKRLLESQNSRR